MKATISNDAPTSRVRNTDMPTIRAGHSALMTPAVPGTSFAGQGYLIGMLGLTYTKVQNFGSTPAMFYSDDIPHVRVRNTD